MKKIFSIILFVVAAVCNAQQISTPEDLLAHATLSYEQGDYPQCIADYEELTNIYRQVPDLYYNLGNAYYKNKDFARAILNYERCLLFDPSNEDAKANLELANANCVDKIETIQPIIFKTWSDAVCNLFSCSTWTNLAIAFFLIFSICLGGYFFMRKVWIRKTGFYIGIVAIIISFISNFYANQQNDKIAIRDKAIVIAPSVTVKSSPADSGTQLFTIHEGLKVKVRSTLSGWSEVELSDGNVGWLPSSAVEVI